MPAPAHTKTEAILGKVFVTPAMHRKHHSTEGAEQNSNYGTIFSFWDRWLRTYQTSSSEDRIIVGLSGDIHSERGITALLKMPFRRQSKAA